MGKTLTAVFPEHDIPLRLTDAIEESLRTGSSSVLSKVFTPHPLPLMQVQDPNSLAVQSVTVQGLENSSGEYHCLLEIQDVSHADQREKLMLEKGKQVKRKAGELEALNEVLRLKNEELDAFVEHAGHDLDAPVTQLQAFCGLLRADLGNDLVGHAASDLDHIESSAHRLAALIKSLMLLARAGKSAIEIEDAPMLDCAQHALDLLSNEILNIGATVEVDELPVVPVDGCLMRQVYQNLIGNAVKFCDPVRPRLHLTHERIHGEHVFGVRDNGIGIDPEHAMKVFEAFTCLNGKSEYEGTGIGLSICKKIVERHGGRIWVETDGQRGAHFKFTLPDREHRELRAA